MRNIRLSILFIVSIFCVVIILFIIYNLYNSKDGSILLGNGKNSNPSDGTAKAIAMEYPDITPRQDFVYPLANIRDPFQTGKRAAESSILTTQTVKPLSLKLTGVIWGKGESIAIIEDSKNETHLAKAGEEIDGVKVIDIKPGMVKVQRDNEVIELALWSEIKMDRH